MLCCQLFRLQMLEELGHLSHEAPISVLQAMQTATAGMVAHYEQCAELSTPTVSDTVRCTFGSTVCCTPK